MVNVGIFCDHLEYFMAIWYNVWPFGIVCDHLLHFSQFGMFGPRKIRQPCFRVTSIFRKFRREYKFLAYQKTFFFHPSSADTKNVQI
jgi:hypothetical protein